MKTHRQSFVNWLVSGKTVRSRFSGKVDAFLGMSATLFRKLATVCEGAYSARYEYITVGNYRFVASTGAFGVSLNIDRGYRGAMRMEAGEVLNPVNGMFLDRRKTFATLTDIPPYKEAVPLDNPLKAALDLPNSSVVSLNIRDLQFVTAIASERGWASVCFRVAANKDGGPGVVVMTCERPWKQVQRLLDKDAEETADFLAESIHRYCDPTEGFYPPHQEYLIEQARAAYRAARHKLNGPEYFLASPVCTESMANTRFKESENL